MSSFRLAGSLAHLQSLYDRHRYIDLYGLTSEYWNEATDVSALPVDALILGARSAERLGGPRLSRWLLRRAFERDPSDPRVRYFTHRLNPRRLSILDELKESIADPDLGGEETDLRASWYAACAFTWAVLRDFDRAAEGLRIARTLAPDDGYVLHLESSVYGLADRWADALRSAERTWEVDPGSPYGAFSLGTALINLGRVEESAARLSAEAGSSQSYEVVLIACWHLCALAETLDGEPRRSALDRARSLAGRLPELMPLADRETRRSVARTNLDIAHLADDYAGIERWSAEVHSPFHRQLLANLARNTEGTRIRLPFRRTIQKYDACVPASLAAALSAGGVHIAEDDMAAAMTFGGTAPWAAADWLRARGLHVRFFFATPDVATRLIREKIAFVVSWESDEAGHAVAVVGLDERSGTLLVHDPNSFRSDEYLLTALDSMASPLGIQGLAAVTPEQAPKLDSLLPPDSAVMAAGQEHSKRLRFQGPSASRQVVADVLGQFPSHPGSRYLEAAQELEDGQIGQALGKLKDLLREFPRSPLVRGHFMFACYALRNSALLRQALKDIVEEGRLPGLDDQQDWIYPPDRYVYEYADLLRISTDTRQRAESLLLKLIRRQWTSAGAWHNLADLLWQNHDRPGAILGYKLASCLAESNEHFARAYADALAADRREEEALQWLESRARRFSNAPHAVNTWMTWIGALEDRGYPERALSACNEALAQHGASAELLSFAVPFFARMGDWARAEAERERLRNAGLPHAFLEASTRLDQMRGDLESAARQATAWMTELPRSIDARRSLLDIVDAREGHDAAVRVSRQWMRENPDHEDFEDGYLAQLDRASAPEGKKYAVLLRRLKRNPDDAWAWCELAFDSLSEYRRADDRKRQRLEPRIARDLIECDRTATGTAPTLRAHALWAEYRGDWAAAVARSLESIALEPETFYSYGRAWECSARFKADERQDLWSRIEPLFVNSTGRLTIARDVMAMIAARFGIAAAEKTVENWRAARPEDPDILEAAADLLIDHGHGRSDGARAISLLEPAVRRYPYHPGLRFSLANAYHRAGRDPDAEAVLVEIVRRHPNISAAKIRLAWIRSRTGDAEGAKRYLDEAMAAEPRNPELIGCWAQILIDHGRFDEAIRVIEGGLGRLPLDARWRDRAVSLLARCGAADQAIRAARGGVEADPGSAYPWLVLGRTLNDMRQYAEVGEIERCCRKSLELNGALFEAAELLALLLTEQRQYDDASKIMLDIEPRLTDPSPARGRLAWIRRQRGPKSEAVADLANVLEDHPWFGWGWNVLMDWLEEDAVPDQTRQRLQTIPPPLFTDTSFRLRRLLLLEKARAEGTQLDEEWGGLLRDFPEDVSLHVRRYDVLADAQRWPEAAAVIDAIETIEPDDPFILARRCEVLARDHQKEAALEIALRVGFRPVEEYTWPAEKVWDVARTEGFAGDLFSRVRQRLTAGGKPTLQSFSRMAAYAMRNEAKRPSQPRPLIWFPRGGARELMRLVDLVSGAPWDGSEHRAIAYDLLCDYGYGRLVAKLAAKIAPADITAANEWGQIGRAFIDGHLYADARRFFHGWRERTGVAMWMVANYVLSLSRFRRDQLRERYDSARDALAGLPHDYCAKYLAHIQAEASALLGRNDLFLETWASHARFFDGKLDDGSYFAKKDRYLLTSLPRLADDLTQHRAGRARRMVMKLWLRRLLPSWVALKSEGHKGMDTSLILISLVLLTIIARSFISQTTDLNDFPAPPSLSERGLSRTGPIVGGQTGSRGQQSPGQPSAGAIDRFSLSLDNRDLVATVTRTTSGKTSYGAMGEVLNKSTKTFHFVMVRVEFYDRWGRVVGTLMTEGNRNEYVLPGRAIAFTVRRNGKLDYATAKASIAYSVEVK